MTIKTIVCNLLLVVVFSGVLAQPPLLFGANVISTEDDEFGITFSPDGKTCFFTKRTPSTISNSTYVICYSRFINNQWNEPEIASFSGRYKDLNPFISPDGSKLFFISNRPGPGKTSMDGDIWMAKKIGDGWGEPENIGAPVNTPGWELSCTITASGSIYFTSFNTGTGKQGLYRSKLVNGKYQPPEIDVICFSQYKNGKWQTPEVAPFSGVYRDFDPVLSPDGTKMLFTSSRPVNGTEEAGYDIWMVEKTVTGWGEPIHLDTTINSKYNEHFASIASNGTIYFSSDRPGAMGGEGDADIYRSRFVDGKYMPAERLDSVSSTAYELDCLVAPDESFILTGCYGRKGCYGNYDIYYSKNVNGVWSVSKNLGPKVNTRFRDYSPRISPDGKYLFFTSEMDFSAE